MSRSSCWAVLGVLAMWAGQGRAQDLVIPAGFFAEAPAAVQGPVPAGPADASFPSCGGCACAPCGLIGGVGLYLIQPYFASNLAYTVFRQGHGPGDRVDVSQHMAAAPLCWLGYVGESGLGARARWWYFRQGSSQRLDFGPTTDGSELSVNSATPLGVQLLQPITDTDGATFVATSKLQLQVVDLEGIKQSVVDDWDLVLSAGVRLAHITQAYNAFTNTDIGFLVSGHSFHGVGPVLALEVRYPWASTGLAFYSSARGSLLFGSAKQNVFATPPPPDPDQPPDDSPRIGQDHRTRVLPVGELEVGLELGRPIGAARGFGQLALVGQDWIGAGNASRSLQVSQPTGFPVSGASADSDLGFFGFVVRLGLDY